MDGRNTRPDGAKQGLVSPVQTQQSLPASLPPRMNSVQMRPNIVPVHLGSIQDPSLQVKGGTFAPYPQVTNVSPPRAPTDHMPPKPTDQLTNPTLLPFPTQQFVSLAPSQPQKRLPLYGNAPRVEDAKKVKVDGTEQRTQQAVLSQVPANLPDQTRSYTQVTQSTQPRLPPPNLSPLVPGHPPNGIDASIAHFRSQQPNLSQRPVPQLLPQQSRNLSYPDQSQLVKSEDGLPQMSHAPLASHSNLYTDSKGLEVKREMDKATLSRFDYQSPPSFSSHRDMVDRLSLFTSFQDDLVEKIVKSCGPDRVRTIIQKEEEKLTQRFNATFQGFHELFYKTANVPVAGSEQQGAPVNSNAEIDPKEVQRFKSVTSSESTLTEPTSTEIKSSGDTKSEIQDWLHGNDIFMHEMLMALELLLHKRIQAEHTDLSNNVRSLTWLLQTHESSLTAPDESGQTNSTQSGG
eukprot:c7495_g1_i1.p1 GENE.c7495_g1_i1~~c7495_g1_i1.p1  ORF type:complete len:460 (-),score=67.72 c7495_g1_i1:948-2327(-)